MKSQKLTDDFSFSDTKKMHSIILAIIVLTIIAAICLPRIPQPLNYHDLADKRTFFGIPSFFHLITSLGFFVVSIWGLITLFGSKSVQRQFILSGEKWLFATFFVSVLGRGGSEIYYHLNPCNETIVYGRFFVSSTIGALYGIFIAAKISPRIGVKTFLPLVLLALGCALAWKISEINHLSDIRFYSALKISAFVALPLILLLYQGNYQNTGYLAQSIIWLIVARLCEIFDKDLFLLTGNIISGHTCSHLLTSFSFYLILLYLQQRKMLILSVDNIQTSTAPLTEKQEASSFS